MIDFCATNTHCQLDYRRLSYHVAVHGRLCIMVRKYKLAGHSGTAQIYVTVLQRNYQSQMAADITFAVRDCADCEKILVCLLKRTSYLKLFPLLKSYNFIAITILGSLLESQSGLQLITSNADRLAKLVQEISLSASARWMSLKRFWNTGLTRMDRKRNYSHLHFWGNFLRQHEQYSSSLNYLQIRLQRSVFYLDRRIVAVRLLIVVDPYELSEKTITFLLIWTNAPAHKSTSYYIHHILVHRFASAIVTCYPCKKYALLCHRQVFRFIFLTSNQYYGFICLNSHFYGRSWCREGWSTY